MKVLAGVPACSVARRRCGAAAWPGGRTLAAVTGALLLLACGALGAPAARASVRTVCCFRITLKVSGIAVGDYKKWNENADQGKYLYDWAGVAYGIAHLQGDVLETDQGVGAGSLVEINRVVDHNGQPADGTSSGCVNTRFTNTPGFRFARMGDGWPKIGVGGAEGGVNFGPPFDRWQLYCGRLSSEVYSDLSHVGPWYAPGQFFFHYHLGPLPARPLAAGRPQKVICLWHERASHEYMDAQGVSAVLINVVYFPAGELKRQRRHLRSFVGKDARNAWNAGAISNYSGDMLSGRPLPSNGCHKR